MSADLTMPLEQFERLPELFREIILTDADIALDREAGVIDLETRKRRRGLSRAAEEALREAQNPTP